MDSGLDWTVFSFMFFLFSKGVCVCVCVGGGGGGGGYRTPYGNSKFLGFQLDLN